MAPAGAHGVRYRFVAAAAGVLAGGALALAGAGQAADAVWVATTLAGVGPAAWWVWDRARHRQLGVDVVALLALLGTLAVGEYLAGAVITVMLATGRTLETIADARARRDLQAVVARHPTTVHRYRGTELLTEQVEVVEAGDVLLVKPGEIVPVDGIVARGVAVLDESTLTGEPLPVERHASELIRSGTVNAGGPFDLRATATAAASTYAGIVRLVEQAEASSAPFVRLADRYAAVFLGLSLTLAALAWAVTRDPGRAVAVLVVATPCPLILAAPVAVVSGLSRAARRGVIVKGGAALEQLARGRVVLFDKTGRSRPTPVLSDIVAQGDVREPELLRLAASLDQVSSHVLAAAVVKVAAAQRLELSLPNEVVERPGHGIRGRVEGHDVAVGKPGLVGASEDDRWVRSVRRRADLDGSLTVFAASVGEPAGALLFDDPIRLDAARTIRALRREGIDRVVMVTGDRADVAETVGAVLGIDDVFAERTPADKLDAVAVERRWGPTIIVGDGVNDAPALASADVGVALGARGASVSSASADVVITVDRLDRLGDRVAIARRTQAIAVQSVVAGVGLSVVAMGFAAAGLIAAAWGALLQEVIDVAVIVNALRARRDDRRPRHAPTASEAGLVQRFGSEHVSLRPELERVRGVGDALGGVDRRAAVLAARDLHGFLVDELLPHERAEAERLYPAIARSLGGDEPMASMQREHVEIAHQIRRLGRLLDGIDIDAPGDEDLLELRRLLYGLYAVLRLHFAQEDERYFAFTEDAAPDIRGTTGALST